MLNKKIAGIILASFLIIVFGAVLFLSGGNNSQVKVASYSASENEKPHVEVTKDAADLGTIKVSDIKTEDFTIKNTGNKPLQLSNIQSSCMCTFGQIIYQGKTSSEFGMHAESDYVAEVAAGQEAIVRVTYKPYLMPVYGNIEREVYVTTNDPSNQKLVFKVTAYVK